MRIDSAVTFILVLSALAAPPAISQDAAGLGAPGSRPLITSVSVAEASDRVRSSTTWAIRKLGGKNWNRLHVVYAAAICGVIHYWWQVKTGVITPLTITVVLAVLFLARPVTSWLQRREARAAVAASSVPFPR